jgi:hypothetical protein
MRYNKDFTAKPPGFIEILNPWQITGWVDGEGGFFVLWLKISHLI